MRPFPSRLFEGCVSTAIPAVLKGGSGWLTLAPVISVSHDSNTSFPELKRTQVTRLLKTLLLGHTQKPGREVSKRLRWWRNPNDCAHELLTQSTKKERKGKAGEGKGGGKGKGERGKENKRKERHRALWTLPHWLINRAAWTTGPGSPGDTIALNLSGIPILAATRATLPDLWLVKLSVSKKKKPRKQQKNGWKSRPLTSSSPQMCQCLRRVLSSHTELTAPFIRGLEMSA